jgi:CRP-like cAMP-binding protein
MISSSERTATAIALTNCQLVAVNAAQFKFMVQETPYFAEWMLGILGKRLIQMNHGLIPDKRKA